MASVAVTCEVLQIWVAQVALASVASPAAGMSGAGQVPGSDLDGSPWFPGRSTMEALGSPGRAPQTKKGRENDK